MNLRRKILCKEALEKEVQLSHTELILEKLTGKEGKLKKADIKTKKKLTKRSQMLYTKSITMENLLKIKKSLSQKFLMSLLQPKLRQREPMQQLSDIIHFTEIIIKENSADYLYIKYQQIW